MPPSPPMAQPGTEGWLGRFTDPRPIRRRGLLDLYACHQVGTLEPRVVYVGAPGADPAEVASTLDGIAEAHGRVASPHVPALEHRGRTGELDFVALRCDAVADLECVSAVLSRREHKAAHASGLVLVDAVHAAVAAAHDAPGGPVCLGRLAWDSVLFGPDGHVWLVGFGRVAVPVAGIRAVGPGHAEAPEVTLGAPPTPAADIYALYAFARSMMPFVELAPGLALALQGRGTPETEAVTAAMLDLTQRATALDPTQRPPTVSDLNAIYATIRRALGLTPDPDGWRATITRALAVSQAAAMAPRETPVLAGGCWHGGRYRVDRPIASGASGTVFAGHDRQLDQPVALKMIAAEGSDIARRRFYREVRILRTVSHPHLVRGYDLFEESGRLVAVMELVGGERLDARERPDDELLGAGAQVADALASLHTMGVVHRDVKPANIVVSESRGAVLVDFGVAKTPGSDTVTRTEGVVGTTAFMAPEQRAGADTGPPADVFGLCASLRAAFGPSDLPSHAEAALTRGLDPDPTARPSAAELAARLRGDAWAPAATADRPAPRTFHLDRDARTATLPDGTTIDLTRRRVLRRVIEHLVDSHLADPQSERTVEDLREAAWPGEKMLFESARARVYVAIYSLRKLGFDDVILRRDDGYLLDPDLRVLTDASR